MSAITKSEPQPDRTECRVAPDNRIEYVAPRVNLHQDAEGYRLEAEMPGVGRDGIDVTVEDGKLTLVGHRKSDTPQGRLVYRERRPTAYRRVFDLDPHIDPEKITARIEQGLLTVHLPKAETAKPRKVTVS